jgi:flagellar motor switch protein FliN/FliY
MSADAANVGEGPQQLLFLRDVNLELTVELGRTTKPLKDVLHLAPGEVVVLDRPAGAPADLYVNGALFARGQIVEAVETGEYAIRITEIVAPAAGSGSPLA